MPDSIEQPTAAPSGRELDPRIRDDLELLSLRLSPSPQARKRGQLSPDRLKRRADIAARVRRHVESLRKSDDPNARLKAAREIFSVLPDNLSIVDCGISILHEVEKTLSLPLTKQVQEQWRTRKDAQGRPFSLIRAGWPEEEDAEEDLEEEIDPIVQALSVPEDEDQIGDHRYFYVEDGIMRIGAGIVQRDIRNLEALLAPGHDEITPEGRKFIRNLKTVLEKLFDDDLNSANTQVTGPGRGRFDMATAPPEMREAIGSVRVLLFLIFAALAFLSLMIERKKLANGELPVVALLYAGLAILCMKPNLFRGRAAALREQMGFLYTPLWEKLYAKHFRGLSREQRERFARDMTKEETRERVSDFLNTPQRKERIVTDDSILLLLTGLGVDGKIRKSVAATLRSRASSAPRTRKEVAQILQLSGVRDAGVRNRVDAFIQTPPRTVNEHALIATLLTKGDITAPTAAILNRIRQSDETAGRDNRRSQLRFLLAYTAGLSDEDARGSFTILFREGTTSRAIGTLISQADQPLRQPLWEPGQKVAHVEPDTKKRDYAAFQKKLKMGNPPAQPGPSADWMPANGPSPQSGAGSGPMGVRQR